MEDQLTPAELVRLVNSALGPEAISLGNDSRFTTSLISTGVLPIDYLLGGGVPRNRWTEFYGDFSTLKSYVALKCAAEVQKMGGVAALIDTEHSFDPVWATNMGVDPNQLLVLHPETGEAAVDATEMLVRAGVDLVIWDSVAATLPLEEQSKSELKDKHQPARLAALMSRATRKITACNKKTALLCVNQTRTSVGVVFGNPETTPGGKALPFYASHRVSMRKAGKVAESINITHGSEIKKVNRTVAFTIKATIEKSKLTKPFQDVYFRFDLEKGAVDELQFLIDIAIDKGIITNPKGQTWQLDIEDWEGVTCRGRSAIPEMVRKSNMEEVLKERVLFLHGLIPPVKEKAVTPKKQSLKRKVSESTPCPEPEESSEMPPTASD